MSRAISIPLVCPFRELGKETQTVSGASQPQAKDGGPQAHDH